MTDWERIYESELIPLVRKVESEASLWKCIAVVVRSLFQRRGDDVHRARLQELFHQEIDREADLGRKIAAAVRILRYTKERRKELARAAAYEGVVARSDHGPDIDAAEEALGSGLDEGLW